MLFLFLFKSLTDHGGCRPTLNYFVFPASPTHTDTDTLWPAALLSGWPGGVSGSWAFVHSPAEEPFGLVSPQLVWIRLKPGDSNQSRIDVASRTSVGYFRGETLIRSTPECPSDRFGVHGPYFNGLLRRWKHSVVM